MEGLYVLLHNFTAWSKKMLHEVGWLKNSAFLHYIRIACSAVSNGRCNVSECVQETFGCSATEEDGFLYGLVVRKTRLAACSFYDTAR